MSVSRLFRRGSVFRSGGIRAGFPLAVVFLFFLAVFAAPALYAQDDPLDGLFDEVTDVEISGGSSPGDGFVPYDGDEGTGFTGDLDSLFEDAEDISAEEADAGGGPASKSSPATGGLNALLPESSPLSVSGHLVTEVGLGYVWAESGNNLSGYFDFENILTLSARASRNLSLTGRVLTEFPSFNIGLDEIFFDYLLFDRIYLSGGKRQYYWGYVRLFDDDDEYDDDEYDDKTGRFQPNILYDSKENISARLVVPVSVFSFSAVAMFPLLSAEGHSGTDPVSPSFMSFAGSAEARIGRTTVNIFGRKFPSSVTGPQGIPILGLEAKRTILGFDLYLHAQARIASFYRLADLRAEGFDRITFVVGIMRLWDSFKPNIAVNLEYQNVFRPEPADSDPRVSQRLAFVGAVTKIGPGERLTAGVEWNHDLTDCSGDVTPGVIVSGFLPHARWKTAAEIYYGKDPEGARISSPTIRLGSTIYLEMDY